MAAPQALEPLVLTAIEDYFRLLQAHVPAEQMLAEVLTQDFETGFVGGFTWRGPDGLADFLSTRAVFFDESHEILQLMDVEKTAEDVIRARTRLRFSLRRRDPGAAVSEEFTGQAFHTWLFRADPSGPGWRVAAQMVDGFALLDDNAAALFSTPDEGMRT
ncbi:MULTISPECIES: hypothetical protein [unclassified Geodermatophilus]